MGENIIMKKITSSLMAVIWLFASIFAFVSCEGFRSLDTGHEETVIGEVVYVKVDPYAMEKTLDQLSYRVYIKMIDKPANSEWIVFKLDIDTEMESEFSHDLDKMTEVAVGSIVEIKFNIGIANKPGNHSSAYHIKSIKHVNLEKLNDFQNPDLELSYFEKHQSYYSDGSYTTKGEVIHVAKVGAEVGGYIVYIEYNDFALRRYWIDDNTVLDPEIEKLIDEGLIGHRIEITNCHTYPFYNRDIRLAESISLVS